jgi:hypothetical protein
MSHAFRTLRMIVAVAVVLGLNGNAFSQAMNEDLMGRLIKFTLNNKETGTLASHVCKVLNLCDGTADMPFKLSIADSTERNAKHYFGINPATGPRDIVFVVLTDKAATLEAYLTDKTGRLRAAAISENRVARLITNESAAAKFKAELALFAKEAAEQLPKN